MPCSDAKGALQDYARACLERHLTVMAMQLWVSSCFTALWPDRWPRMNSCRYSKFGFQQRDLASPQAEKSACLYSRVRLQPDKATQLVVMSKCFDLTDVGATAEVILASCWRLSSR